MSSSLVVLVAVVAVAILLAAVIVRARRAVRTSRREPTEPIDRAELQARQRSVGGAGRTEHGYGVDRTYGGGGSS
ncbi:MAG: hypothetical protein NTV28_15205 [Propionibacteriales bacterium]|nr:hypothetical protein [Propionibacteriales bacterium]